VLRILKINEAKLLLANARIIFPNEIILQNLIDKLKSIQTIEDSEINVTVEFVSNEQVSKTQISSLKLTELKDQLSALIIETEMTDSWDKEVTTLYIQLSKKLGRRSVWLNEKNQTLATLYLQKSVAMRDEKRFVESRRFLEKAKKYNNAIFGLEDEEAILLALENIVRVRHKAKQQLAKIEGLKTSLSIQLKAQEMQAALRTYEDIKRILGRNDPYVSHDAKQNITQTYYKRASELFKSKEYEQSLLVITDGLNFDSHHSGLRTLKNKALKQKKLRENSLLLAKQALERKNVAIPVSRENIKEKMRNTEKTNKKSIDRCKSKFAGYGKRKRANCYDTINNQIKAPLLVVVPAKSPEDKPFAISKYEITIKDYNYFCQQSGKCSVIKSNKSLPATNLSIDSAKKYVQWLSKITARQYSIPTSEQWLHAAKTNKTVSYNDVNCRIKFGSKLLKGQNLLAANTGQSNPWGIMNIVGNAREFVVDNTKTMARGGAYVDSIKDCTLNHRQLNIAQGDSSTGFRIVREIN
jgi:tetratricopeptide (TPR) repeat protein